MNAVTIEIFRINQVEIENVREMRRIFCVHSHMFMVFTWNRDDTVNEVCERKTYAVRERKNVQNFISDAITSPYQKSLFHTNGTYTQLANLMPIAMWNDLCYLQLILFMRFSLLVVDAFYSSFPLFLFLFIFFYLILDLYSPFSLIHTLHSQCLFPWFLFVWVSQKKKKKLFSFWSEISRKCMYIWYKWGECIVANGKSKAKNRKGSCLMF